MHIHILGICGTFMGSLAQLAAASGHRVTGSDADVYPPMSDQLQAAGIALIEGYDPAQLQPAPDLVVIGNALSRGNPCVEAVLERGLNYTSGPQWLGKLRGQGKFRKFRGQVFQHNITPSSGFIRAHHSTHRRIVDAEVLGYRRHRAYYRALPSTPCKLRRQVFHKQAPHQPCPFRRPHPERQSSARV